MTIRQVLVSALLALGVVACSKPSDLPKLEEEASATVASFQPQIARLDRRIDVVAAQGEQLAQALPGADDAIRALNDARAHAAELHGLTAQTKADIASPDKMKDPGAPADPAERLHYLIDTRKENFELGLRTTNTMLTTAESWVSQARQRPLPKGPTPALLAPTDEDPDMPQAE